MEDNRNEKCKKILNDLYGKEALVGKEDKIILVRLSYFVF